MLKRFTIFCFIAVGSVLGPVRLGHAQMGKPRFQFRNRAEVKAAVLANLKQPRTTYDILICAGRQGMIGTAVETYSHLIAEKPFDATPEIKSAYALSHHLTLYPQLWFWKREMTPGLVSQEWGNIGKVTLFRDDALASRSDSPEVLLGSAIWLSSQGDSQLSKAQKLVERALKLDSNWADLHYWHGQILILRAFSNAQKEQKDKFNRFLNLALKALDKARELDVAFQIEDLPHRQVIYENIGKPREALAAFDKYVRYRPDWLNWRGQKQKRSRLLAQIAKQ